MVAVDPQYSVMVMWWVPCTEEARLAQIGQPLTSMAVLTLRLMQPLNVAEPCNYSSAHTGWRCAAAVYRYNTITGTHFFTVSAAERDFIIRTYPQFNYENVAFYAYADAANGRSPIFRFYNNATGTHFFSASVAERDFVIATYPQFQYENIQLARAECRWQRSFAYLPVLQPR